MHDFASGAEWLVSVRNTRKELVCGIDVAAVFSGQDGKDVDGQAVTIQGTPYNNHPEGCLASGEVGLGRHLISGKSAPVTHIMYRFEGRLPTDAVKVVDVGIESIRVVSSSASSGTVRGTFRNDGSQVVINAAVYVFSLNAVGRPFAAEVVRNTSPMMPASGWVFEVSVPGPLEKYAAFAPFEWQWP